LAERLAFEQPDEYLRRREFLGRMAMLAGTSAGMGLLIDPEALVAEAAARQRKAALPSPRNMPIDTFVVLMMENRSFDHYLGWLPGADGQQAGLSYTDASGKSFQTHRLTPDFQGCAFLDPDHSWEGGRTEFDGGKMDGFLRPVGRLLDRLLRGEGPAVHPQRGARVHDVRPLLLLAARLDLSQPRVHALGAVVRQDRQLAAAPAGLPGLHDLPRAEPEGRVQPHFFTDLPVAALWGAPGLARSGQVQEYYERCADGKLPALSFVDPQFEDEGLPPSLARQGRLGKPRRLRFLTP
jgi:phospholipase C